MEGEHRFPTARDTEAVYDGLEKPATAQAIARRHNLTYKQAQAALKALGYQGKVTSRKHGCDRIYMRRRYE